LGRKPTIVQRKLCVYCEEHRVHINADRKNEIDVCGRCYNFVKKYKKPPKNHKPLGRRYKFKTYIRPKVLERDNYTCKMCGNKEELHVHHIIPIKEGGSDDLTNLITLCVNCHSKQHPTVSFFKKKEKVNKMINKN
jgi:5-methylcytosine-specific restriction endonuclease McrA